MQPEIEDLADFAFLSSAKTEIASQNLTLEEALSQENVTTLAKNRIRYALDIEQQDDFIPTPEEILFSYPVSKAIVSEMERPRLNHTFAQSESQRYITRVENRLKSTKDSFPTLSDFESEYNIKIEPVDYNKLIDKTALHESWVTHDDTVRNQLVKQLPTDTANIDTWDSLKQNLITYYFNQTEQALDTQHYYIPVADYIRSVNRNRDERRLAEKPIQNGKVIISFSEVLDVLQYFIFESILVDESTTVPESLQEKINPHVEEILSEIPDDFFFDEIDEVNENAFPPVITHILSKLNSGEFLQHECRFTLATFLLNIGESPEQVIETFSQNPYFDGDQTEYQINHLASAATGGESSEYTPPTYETIKTWGLDWTPDSLEQQVSHPLVYYRIKLNETDSSEEESSEEKEDTQTETHEKGNT